MPGGNPRARVRRPTPAEMAAPLDDEGAANAGRELEQVAEVDAEGGDYEGYLTVTLQADDGPIDLLVKPQGEWRRAENTALRMGDWDTLASLVMPAEDYDAWVEADPSNSQVLDFMRELGRSGAVEMGPTSRSSRSSRSTRRR